MSPIIVKNLWKNFGAIQAVKGLSFTSTRRGNLWDHRAKPGRKKHTICNSNQFIIFKLIVVLIRSYISA
jgi:hypothetical protein